jgi:hypothetical protein
MFVHVTLSPIILPAQVEAVCQSLLTLGVKALDLGDVIAKCPTLLACPADVIHDMVSFPLQLSPLVARPCVLMFLLAGARVTGSLQAWHQQTLEGWGVLWL